MSRSAYNESYPEPDGRLGTHIPIINDEDMTYTHMTKAQAKIEFKAQSTLIPIYLVGTWVPDLPSGSG